MTNQTNSPKFSPEVRERAVLMVAEHRADHPSQWAAIASIAAEIGCTAQTLSNWVKQAERDQGRRAGLTTDGLRRREVGGQPIIHECDEGYGEQNSGDRPRLSLSLRTAASYCGSRSPNWSGWLFRKSRFLACVGTPTHSLQAGMRSREHRRVM